MNDLAPAWMWYGIIVTALVFIVFAVCQYCCVRIEREELPKDLAQEAFKVATRPKKPLKELDQ